jgi:hypothetical protein
MWRVDWIFEVNGSVSNSFPQNLYRKRLTSFKKIITFQNFKIKCNSRTQFFKWGWGGGMLFYLTQTTDTSAA